MKKSHNNRRRHPRGRHPHHRHHQYGIGQQMVYLEDHIDNLRQLFKRHATLDWAVRLITTEGPAHKQINSSLILGLLAQIFKYINSEDISLKTIQIIGMGPGHRENGFEYPIELPESVLEMVDEEDEEDVLEYIGDGPLEGTALDLVLLNALTVLLKHFETINPNTKTESDEK